ncbi:MAG: 4-oxalomesaconate tautomerase [Granulosicoccus sp.]|nr:4-oxalomesaconate tautomerase [Granulosicoccus sp.]
MSKTIPTAQRAIPFMQFRGGSSKGIFFSLADLPADTLSRDEILLSALGRDSRQIDGMGGGNPLTSKVAIVGPSSRKDCDVDYLFAQIIVGENKVDTTPNCGNILAAVGPFAIESGMVTAAGEETKVRVNMVNTGGRCDVRVSTPGGRVQYRGDAKVDGVPGTASPVVCQYTDIAGAVCGTLLPTGNARDRVNDIDVTCIDNGMPVVILKAEAVGKTGYETPDELMADNDFCKRLESLRLAVGPMMNLGDVENKVVPKMTLVTSPVAGGSIHTRTFIPHNCHTAIGVLGAVSVATACLITESVAAEVAILNDHNQATLSIEHPSGEFSVEVALDSRGNIETVGLLRTARLLSRGELYI